MQRLIYGVFPDRAMAENAVQVLHRQAETLAHEGEAASAAIHQDEIIPDELPARGTLAKGAAISGGVFVGGLVGLLLGLMASGAFARIGGPERLVGSHPLDLVFMVIAAGLFGAVVTGIAGTAGNRAKVRQLECELTKGRVVLTLEASSQRMPSITRTMTNCGALRTGSI